MVCVCVCVYTVVCVCVCMCVCVCVLVPFETNIDDAAVRKVHRYRDLRDACALTCSASIVTLEVGSRGFLYVEGFQKLYRLLRAKQRDIHNFELELVRHVIVSSYNVWCKRNWCV